MFQIGPRTNGSDQLPVSCSSAPRYLIFRVGGHPITTKKVLAHCSPPSQDAPRGSPTSIRASSSPVEHVPPSGSPSSTREKNPTSMPAPSTKTPQAPHRSPRLASLTIKEQAFVQQMSVCVLLDDTITRLVQVTFYDLCLSLVFVFPFLWFFLQVWTQHKELASRVPCLLEAHQGSLIREVKQMTQADHLEGEVCEARSKVEHLSEELS